MDHNLRGIKFVLAAWKRMAGYQGDTSSSLQGKGVHYAINL